MTSALDHSARLWNDMQSLNWLAGQVELANSETSVADFLEGKRAYRHTLLSE